MTTSDRYTTATTQARDLLRWRSPLRAELWASRLVAEFDEEGDDERAFVARLADDASQEAALMAAALTAVGTPASAATPGPEWLARMSQVTCDSAWYGKADPYGEQVLAALTFRYTNGKEPHTVVVAIDQVNGGVAVDATVEEPKFLDDLALSPATPSTVAARILDAFALHDLVLGAPTAETLPPFRAFTLSRAHATTTPSSPITASAAPGSDTPTSAGATPESGTRATSPADTAPRIPAQPSDPAASTDPAETVKAPEPADTVEALGSGNAPETGTAPEPGNASETGNASGAAEPESGASVGGVVPAVPEVDGAAAMSVVQGREVDLPEVPGAREAFAALVEFVGDRPLWWSPSRVSNFLTVWLPREAILSGAAIAAMPEVVRAWTRHIADHPEILSQIDADAPGLPERMADPTLASLRKRLNQQG